MKKASELMTREVVTVFPQMGIKELAKLFTEEKVGGFPVVEGGKVVGVVTESDLIHRDERLHIPTFFTIFDAVFPIGGEKRLEEELKKISASTVGEIMDKNPPSVGPDATLTEVASLMGEKRAETVLVLDGGALLGVIGRLDLIRAMI